MAAEIEVGWWRFRRSEGVVVLQGGGGDGGGARAWLRFGEEAEMEKVGWLVGP